MSRLVVLALALGLASPAHAFVCTRTGGSKGASLTWKVRTIEFAIGAELTSDFTSADTVRTIVRRSLETWTAVDCSDLSLTYGPEKTGLRATSDALGANENVIVFVQKNWNSDRRVIALTTTAYRATSGELYDADIELNDQGFSFVDAAESCTPVSGTMDLQNALTHELGHTIGLDHPPSVAEFVEGTMYASADPCEIKKRTLAADDVAGVCSIYPSGQPAQPCFGPDKVRFEVVTSEPAGGCSNVGGALGGVGPILGLSVLALVRRRQRG